MKTRSFNLMIALVLLFSLLPAATALAKPNDDGVEFEGIVASLPGTADWIGDWTVDGETVHVTADTRIKQENGPVEVGACVQVQGLELEDGSVDAERIDTREASHCGGSDDGGLDEDSFHGTVEALPAGGLIGDWTVSGRTVHVSDATELDQERGPIAVGVFVEVEGAQETDGSLTASKVEVKMGLGGGGDQGQYVKFRGVVDAMPADGLIGDWLVGGRTVHVNAGTRIDQEDGEVSVGVTVEVTGWAQPDNSLNAVKIEVDDEDDGTPGRTPAKFQGFVEQLPAGGLIGDWLVGGITVTVSADTRIDDSDGDITVGSFVEVKGWEQADGSVLARKIEVKSADDDDDGEVEFYGVVESFLDGFIGAWLISGQTVAVTGTTEIDQERGPVAVGVTVEVHGVRQPDGPVLASKIEVKQTGDDGGSVGFVKFYGVVEDLPVGALIGDWMVSGRLVHVSDATVIDQEHGIVDSGVTVEVKGMQQADGSVAAHKIEVK